MPAYTLSGGPCHWDIELCLYIALGMNYAKNEGALKADNSLDNVRVGELTRDLIRQAERSFNRIFNPRLEQGEYRLFEFQPCCSYHMTARFQPFPWALSGAHTKEEIRDALPDGCGVILVENLSIADHPHTDAGGRVIVVGVADASAHTLAHEIGHALGLPDMYSHPAVPALNVPALDLPPNVEEANRGRLMGKPRNGHRTLHQDEIEGIARLTGMTCDADVCCHKRPRKDPPPEFPPQQHETQKGTRCAHFPPLGAILDIKFSRAKA
jgi:hypothetical protein